MFKQKTTFDVRVRIAPCEEIAAVRREMYITAAIYTFIQNERMQRMLRVSIHIQTILGA